MLTCGRNLEVYAIWDCCLAVTLVTLPGLTTSVLLREQPTAPPPSPIGTLFLSLQVQRKGNAVISFSRSFGHRRRACKAQVTSSLLRRIICFTMCAPNFHPFMPLGSTILVRLSATSESGAPINMVFFGQA